MTASDIEKDLSPSEIATIKGQNVDIREAIERSSVIMKPRLHRRSHTIGHAPVVSQYGDAADLIMDRIDKELFKMTKVGTSLRMICLIKFNFIVRLWYSLEMV